MVVCPAPIFWATFVHGFWHWRTSFQGVMGTDLVVLSEPDIDDDLGLSGCMKPLGIQYFATQCAIEACIVSVLPG